MKYKNIYTDKVYKARVTHITKTNDNGTFRYPYLKLIDKYNNIFAVIPFTQISKYYKLIK